MAHGKAPQEKAHAPAPKERPVPQAQVADDPLSGRERDVVLALGRGLTLKEIAAQLGVAPGTVRALVARSYMKLGVRDAASAVRRYRRVRGPGV
jgi:DNA-binding NarL/FixJ family response regulator